ncbi:MAG TPA: hypothetical protein VE127_07485, partial [Solirubrobacteraceae bacterium]|nr:hypothetical protein [Solirubrobacteraceae bacterium]
MPAPDSLATPGVTDAAALGARGPPGVYGPQLISAANGGTIDAGAATLTFAPGSLPHDAYVTVTVTTGTTAGLGAVSAIYDLKAIDAVTGSVIEHFASAPVLSIGVESGHADGASIYYLPDRGAPQPIGTTYDAATHTVSAGLPHFSTYAVLFSIQSVLQQYANGQLTGERSFSPGDLLLGGIVDISAPTLDFQNITFQGSGAGTTFSGTVQISAASATIATAPFTAAFGAVSGQYLLTSQAATAGTLTLSLSAPSITVAGLASLAAATAKLVSNDDGTTTQTNLGATGVTATAAAGAAGPSLTISGAALGFVTRQGDTAGSSPTFALAGTGNVALSGISGVTLTGPAWQVAYDSMGDLSGSPIAVDTGPGTVSVDLAQPSGVTGPWWSFGNSSSAPAQLTIGGQSVSGVFNATAGASQLTIAASDIGLTMGPSGSPYLTIPNSQTSSSDPGAHGELILSAGGLTGELTVPSITLAVPSVSLTSASGQIEINTQPAPVSQAFTVDGTSTTLALPAGPFVGVAISVDPGSPVAVGPSGSPAGQLAGSLLFEQQSDAGASTTLVAVSNASVWLAGASTPVVTDGQGVFVIEPTGIAGYAAGTAQLSGSG